MFAGIGGAEDRPINEHINRYSQLSTVCWFIIRIILRDHKSKTTSYDEPRNIDGLVDHIDYVNVPEKDDLVVNERLRGLYDWLGWAPENISPQIDLQLHQSQSEPDSFHPEILQTIGSSKLWLWQRDKVPKLTKWDADCTSCMQGEVYTSVQMILSGLLSDNHTKELPQFFQSLKCYPWFGVVYLSLRGEVKGC